MAFRRDPEPDGGNVPPTPAGDPQPASKPAVPARTRRRWLPLLTLLIVPTASFAPQIIAATALRQWIVPTLVPAYPAGIVTRGAMLDWLAPVELYDVVFQDLEGRPLIEIETIRSEKPLWEIFADRRRVGTFHVAKIHARVEMRTDGSNLEDALHALLPRPSEPSSIEQCDVRITDGSVDLVGPQSEEHSRVDRISARFERKGSSAPTSSLTSDGAINDAGSFSAELTSRTNQSDDGPRSDVLDGKLTIKGVAVKGLRMLLARIWPDAKADGTLNAALQGQWSNTGPGGISVIDLGGRIDAAELDIVTASAKRADRLTLKSLSAGGHAGYRDGALYLDDLRMQSDLGNIAVTGTIPVSAIAEVSVGDLARLMEQDRNLHLAAEVDLARAAEMFPASLRIRENVRVTSGTLRATIESKSGADEQAWTGRIEAVQLAATEGERVHRWDAPLAVTFDARRTAAGFVVRELRGQSEFFSLSGRGTLEEAQFEGRCDLDRLMTDLGRFADLSEIDLAGKLSAKLAYRRAPENVIDATAAVLVEGFRVGVPGASPWSEERLTADATVKAVVATGRIAQIESGSLRIAGGNDVLQATVAAPAGRNPDSQKAATEPSASLAESRPSDEPPPESALLPDRVAAATDVPKPLLKFPMECRISGDLATWRTRLNPWVRLSDWDLGGRIDAQARISATAETIHVEQALANLSDFRAFGRGFFIAEKQARFETTGDWNPTRKRWSSKRSTWASNSVSVRVDDVSAVVGDAGPTRADGVLVIRGGLGALLAWVRDPATPAANRPDGIVDIRATLRSDDETTSADWVARIENLSTGQIAAASPDPFRNASIIRNGGRPLNRPETPDRVTTRNDSLVGGSRPATPIIVSRNDIRATSTEPVTLKGAGRYDRRTDVLQIEQLDLSSPGLTLKATGAATELQSRPNVEIAGDVAYDWEALASTLRGYLGEGVRVTGRDARKFAVTGPRGRRSDPANSADDAVVNTGLAGQAGLSWQSADVYGMSIGPGELNATLSGGAVQFAPLDLAVSEGRVTARPRIELFDSPAALVLDKGPLAQNIRFSPVMCRHWLKYAVPLLADAAEIEGRFSVDVEQARVPLSQFSAAEATGVLAIQSAQVRPGALARQLIAVAANVERILGRQSRLGATAGENPLLRAPEQRVDVRMTQGRVYHRRLEFFVGDTRVRTEGSVGLDDSLSIVAVIPIRDEWVESNRMLAGLKGNEVRVPITGTVDRPQVDGRVLQELAARVAGSAAEGALRRGIGKQIDRLISPAR